MVAKKPLKLQQVGDVALQQSSQHRSDQIHYGMYGTKNHVNHYGMHVQCMPRHIENPPFRRLGRLASLTNNLLFLQVHTMYFRWLKGQEQNNDYTLFQVCYIIIIVAVEGNDQWYRAAMFNLGIEEDDIIMFNATAEKTSKELRPRQNLHHESQNYLSSLVLCSFKSCSTLLLKLRSLARTLLGKQHHINIRLRKKGSTSASRD